MPKFIKAPMWSNKYVASDYAIVFQLVWAVVCGLSGVISRKKMSDSDEYVSGKLVNFLKLCLDINTIINFRPLLDRRGRRMGSI